MISLKTDNEPRAISDSPYGYGTMIYLTEDQVEALGIGNLKAGTQVGVKAIAIVTTASQSVSADGDNDGIDTTICLQLTDMEVTAGKAINPNTLYGDES